MANVADARDIAQAQTLIGVFDTEEAARSAVSLLERAGMPPDRIGLVTGNIRQAREVAGSYSPQGALIGAAIGGVLVVAYAVVGGEQFRQNAAAVLMGGLAIIGTFALDGPEKCSGLPVKRYDSTRLGEVLGGDFQLVHTRSHDHATPWAAIQRFQFSVFRRTVLTPDSEGGGMVPGSGTGQK